MGDRTGHRGGRRRGPARAVVLAAVGLAIPAGVAPAGIVVVNGRVVNDEAAGNTQGFLARKQPAPVLEAVEDFERYRDHKAWEKAFAALDKVAAAERDRLVITPDGVAIPPSLKVRRALLSLPPDGRQAYRLFNDAKAQQLFTQATTPPADPAAAPVDDVPLLRQIVDRYFVTTIGDRAADRLGDALFEAGDFAGAEACWRLVLDDFPDSTLDAAQLQVKRAAALARAGSAEAFAQVRDLVRDRYAGQRVRVGGVDVDAAAFVAGLSNRSRPAIATARPTTADAPLAMPASNDPAWQVPLLDEATASALESRLNNYGWGSLLTQILGSVPPALADDRRVYLNFYGATMAVDLATGKLLWRTESPAAVLKAITTGINQGNFPQPVGFALVPAGPDRLLAVGRPPATNNQSQPAGAVLDCLARDDGRRVWSSTAVKSLKPWSFVGRPVLDGDAVHVVAVEALGNNGNGKPDWTLLTLAAADGAVRFKVPLGTPQFGTDNYRGMPTVRPPVLMPRDGRVLVLTNDGAVLCADPKAGRLDWAFAYPPKAEEQANYYYYRPPPQSPAALLSGGGSTLYLKEQGVPAVYALDVADGPAVRWRRPVDADTGLADARDGRLLFVGPSADAVDTAGDQPMRWSNALSVATGDVGPLVAGGHVYVFGRRGVHDLKQSDGTDAGPIFRGGDRDALGGQVLSGGGRLITVSARAVTAYPLGTTAGGH